jgi:plasmid stability protein
MNVLMAMPGGESEGRGPTKIKRWFFREGQEPSSRPTKDCEMIAWEFTDPKTSKVVQRLELDMREVPGGLAPEGACRAAAAFGYSTAAGNAAGGAESMNDAIEAVEERVKVFLEGDWSEGRRAGYSREDLVAAWVKSCQNAGASVTAEQQEAMVQALKSEQITQKDLLADDGVRAELEAIKAQRAIERAAKAKEKASTGDGSKATQLLERLQ